ncbi:MAG: hypothetical protein KAW41_04290 [Candidatus Diapherotrites archaeon]|nr:hypothetical protein [Candidatus Diapherotrites archaeon]
MQYSHQLLLKQMMGKGVSQQKILDYFKAEGYPEAEVLSAINDYERQKDLSDSAKAEAPSPEQPAPTPKQIPRSQDLRRMHMSTKIIVVAGTLVIFTLAAITTYFLMQ